MCERFPFEQTGLRGIQPRVLSPACRSSLPASMSVSTHGSQHEAANSTQALGLPNLDSVSSAHHPTLQLKPLQWLPSFLKQWFLTLEHASESSVSWLDTEYWKPPPEFPDYEVRTLESAFLTGFQVMLFSGPGDTSGILQFGRRCRELWHTQKVNIVLCLCLQVSVLLFSHLGTFCFNAANCLQVLTGAHCCLALLAYCLCKYLDTLTVFSC